MAGIRVNLQDLIQYNPGTGKFTLGPAYSWSPAYSGRNNVNRVRRQRAMYQAVQSYRMQAALTDMVNAGYKDPEGNDYKLPETGNPDWDLARVEADYLDFQLQAQAARAQEMGRQVEEPSGWRGVVYDALNNPAGSTVLRGLDIIGRPGYAVAAGLKGELRAIRGESPDHPGWVPLEKQGIETRFNPRTGRFERIDSAYNRRQGEGQYFKNVETGDIERHDDWQMPSEGGRTQRALKGFAGGAREGFTGRDKASFGQVLREANWLKGKPSAIAGFAGDVALDPTNLISFGTSTTLRRGGFEALEAGEKTAILDSARTVADDAIRTGAVRGPLKETRAYRRALRTAMEDAGVARRPFKEVIADINSSYGEHSIERAMRDRVTEALKDPFFKPGTQRRIAAEARRGYDAAQKALGQAVDPVVRRKVGLDALKAARDEFADKVGADVLDEIATRQALRENLQLDVRLAGRTVASSRTLGRGIAAGSRALRATRLGGGLARTFRTDAEIGDALHRIQRQSMNVGAAEFEEEAKAVKRTFQSLGLSRRQRVQIARAIETGDTKGFSPEMVEGFDRAKEFFQAAFDREVQSGALSPADFKDNYLYHVYKNPNFSRGLGSWVKPIGRGASKFRTLAEAEAAGARPLTDVADILVYRLAKSHRIAASHNMMQTIAGRFGVDLSGRKVAPRVLRGLEGRGVLVEARKISGAGRYFAPGTYFDQDVAASISKMARIFSDENEVSRLGRLFDQVQARMKFLQTAPNPGFHIRNTMSDVFVNFLDGVTNVRAYQRAIQLITNTGDLNRVFVTLRNGMKLTGEDILQLYDGMGLRAGFFHAEAGIIPGMGSKFLTGSSNVIRRGSEIREDVMRMAHFIDALKKAPDVKRIEEAAELAAKRVRKYNFDYQDLTQVERRVFRRAAPFYTFMRKNVPLMLESYMTRPGRMIVPTKGMRALSAYLGNDNSDEPLPGMVSATPEWIRNIPGIEAVAAGPENDAVMIQPDMPYNQLEELFGGFAQGTSPTDSIQKGVQGFLKNILLEQSTPLVRGPAEYASQTDLATGADVPQTPLDALINNFPVGRLIQRPLSNVAPGLFFKSDRPGSPTYTVSIAGNKITVSETVANYITGLGFRKVTPERMQSELRRRQDIIEGILRRMRDAAQEQYQEAWDEQHPEYAGG